MRITVVRWLPWVLVAGVLCLFLVIPGVDGIVLALAWGGLVGLFRYGVALLPDRDARLWVDGIFLVACLLAAFEGGWYLVPATIAFAVKDLGERRGAARQGATT